MSLRERLQGWFGTRAAPVQREVPPAVTASAAPLPDLLDRARRLSDGGNAAAAVALLEHTVAAYPDAGAAYLQLASAHRACGALDEAADCFQLAIHHAPGETMAYLGLAGLLKSSGRIDAAIDLYRQGLARVPRSASLAASLALALFQTGAVDEALAQVDAAVASEPALAMAWHDRGYLRLQTGDAAAALADFEQALALSPQAMATQACRAHALRDLRRFDEALAAYESIVGHAPECEDAVANLATTRLLLGDFARGWPLYEQRFGTAPGAASRGFPYPPWRGEDLAGRSLLVYAEQGLGDELMFASCLPEVLARAGRVTIECSGRLAPLFARAFTGAHVHGGRKDDARDWLGALPPIDLQVPIGSLPRYLRPDAASFPSHRGYLRADPDLVREAAGRLAALGPRPWIGVSWRGGTPAARGLVRSLPLAMLAQALAGTPARFVSLQHGDVSAEEDAARRDLQWPLARLPAVPADLDRLAAKIAVLDLVISVDNTNVHLAGALGRPAWALLPFVPEWRYGERGETMPWYPSVRLFRQTQPGGWPGVLAQVCDALRVRQTHGDGAGA